MTDTLRYHTPQELRDLSLDELRALWDLVPTERQRAYKAAYEREVQAAGAAGSDLLERQVNAALLRRYEESGLVPSGQHWARTPTRVREAAIEGDPLTPPEAAQPKLNPKVLAAFAIAAAVMLFVFIGNSRRDDSRTVAVATETATPSPTPEVSPTPTPLALEAQDDVITGGDSGRAIAYPVNLQIILPGDDAPRVWVVQRRKVSAAEWNYDPNPDIASFVSGMSVRPVIGIPWSEDNAAWFELMGEGAVFNLTMNTGAILRYEFAARTEVRRSDTAIFRQVDPGLVLLLIGETGEDGLPTGTRTLVTASYPPAQELSREGRLIGLTLPDAPPTTSTAVPEHRFAGVHVDVISAATSADRLTTALRIYNGGVQTLHLTPDDIWLALGYAPNPPGPRVPAEGLDPFALLPEQAVDLTLVWSWSGEPFGALGVGEWRFAIELEH